MRLWRVSSLTALSIFLLILQHCCAGSLPFAYYLRYCTLAYARIRIVFFCLYFFAVSACTKHVTIVYYNCTRDIGRIAPKLDQPQDWITRFWRLSYEFVRKDYGGDCCHHAYLQHT